MALASLVPMEQQG